MVWIEEPQAPFLGPSQTHHCPGHHFCIGHFHPCLSSGNPGPNMDQTPESLDALVVAPVFLAAFLFSYGRFSSYFLPHITDLLQRPHHGPNVQDYRTKRFRECKRAEKDPHLAVVHLSGQTGNTEDHSPRSGFSSCHGPQLVRCIGTGYVFYYLRYCDHISFMGQH